MEAFQVYLFLSLCFIFLISKYLTANRHTGPALPPTPWPPLPILGHLHLLKPPLHRTFTRLSQTYGPIFTLKLGVRRVVVVSSPNLVEECFTVNDVVFSNRPWVMVDKYIGYNHTTMAGVPYGHQWRSLRRLGAQEVLSVSRLNSLSEIRQDEMRRSLLTLTQSAEFEKLQLRPKLFDLIFNLIMMIVAGKRYSAENHQFGEEIREMVSEVFETKFISAQPYWA